MTSKCTLIVLSLDRRRVVHLLAEMARDRQKELRHPVFEQIAVGQPLEQRIPVMLVHVDEPGQHEAAVGVDHLIETRGAALPRKLPPPRVRAVDDHEAARMDAAFGIHRDYVTVGNQNSGH